MIKKQFDDIKYSDLEELIENQIPEGTTIDYKKEFVFGTEKEKKDFLYDIASFANAKGGDIIYGISELLDENGRNTGLPDEIVGINNINIDQIKLALGSSIRDSIAPRIHGVHISCIENNNDKKILIIRVTNSLNKPHMVTFKGGQRFYSRTDAGKYPLDIHDISLLVTQSSNMSEKIRDFKSKRLSMIISGDPPLPLLDNPKIILHIIPLLSVDHSKLIDVNQFVPLISKFWPIDSNGCSNRFNYDGLLTYSNRGAPPYENYTQIFRNGVVEAVNANLIYEREEHGKVLACVTFGNKLIESLGTYLDGMKIVGIEVPLFASISLLGIKDYYIPGTGWRDRLSGPMLFDRDNLLLHEVLVEDYSIAPENILHPIFDELWQSAGYANCPHFNAENAWRPITS